jgi:hypothetical protein
VLLEFEGPVYVPELVDQVWLEVWFGGLELFVVVVDPSFGAEGLLLGVIPTGSVLSRLRSWKSSGEVLVPVRWKTTV